MKKILKMYKGLLSNHFIAILIILLFSLPLLALIKSDAVYTTIACLIYVMMIYSAGWNMGFRDTRKVGESFPNIKGAFIAAGLSAVIPAVLLVFRVLVYHINPTAWRPYGEGHEMILTSSPMLVISDIIYKLYHYYFVTFMRSGSLGIYILPIFIPVIIYPIGYLVGLTKFSITERYLPFLIYKPKKKNRK